MCHLVLRELPESMVGAVRLKNLDVSGARPLDTSREVPLGHLGLV